MMIKKNLNILAKLLCTEMASWSMMAHSETILTQKIKNSWMNSTKSMIFLKANVYNLFFSYVPAELRAKYPKGLKVGIKDRTY